MMKLLQEENSILHDRENSLKERERMLSISQENLKTVADLEVKQRVSIVEEVAYIFKTKLPPLQGILTLNLLIFKNGIIHIPFFNSVLTFFVTSRWELEVGRPAV